MAAQRLQAEPLTREAFAPYGDVIETGGAAHFPINDGAVERYHDLAPVSVDGRGRALVNIFECRRPATVPVPVALVERHPLGSQAFVPLDGARMCVVVAPPGTPPEPAALRAFLSRPDQGVSYHPGTWHLPLATFQAGARFLVVDRGGPGDNCEERHFDPASPIVVGAETLRAAGLRL